MTPAQRGLPADIHIPRPFDLDTFCADLAARRGRDLILEPVAFGDSGLTGLWVRYPEHDVIYFESSTTPGHRLHIKLHEIAHMLLDHPHDPGTVRGLRPRLAELVDVDTFDRMYARTSYEEDAERAAEQLAAQILREARRPARPGNNVVGRLEQFFG